MASLNLDEKLLRTILDSLYEVVFVLDNDCRIVYANEAYTRTLGVDVSKVIGKKLSDIEPDAPVLNVLKTGQPIIDCYSHIKSVNVDIVANVVPIYHHGELVGAAAVFRNITELMQLNEKLAKAINEANEAKKLSERYYSELAGLKARLFDDDQIVVKSPAMVRVVELALRVAPIDTTVLITGESGVGKEVIARLIHKHSNRAPGPLIGISLAAIPSNLVESELFGYEKGAFTGAIKDGKAGLFEVANKGTLLLDEIGEMPLELQGKLLRAIQDQQFYPIGSTKPRKVDIRLIACTNRNLEEMVQQRQFREDLFYRLNVVRLHIPPLRERPEEIIPLSLHFLEEFNKKYGLDRKLMPDVLQFFERYSWPGNVRELKNLIERTVILSPDKYITMQNEIIQQYFQLSSSKQPAVNVTGIIPLEEAKAALEKDLIQKALDVGGSIRKAASLLGVDHTTIVKKAARYGLKKTKTAAQVRPPGDDVMDGN